MTIDEDVRNDSPVELGIQYFSILSIAVPFGLLPLGLFFWRLTNADSYDTRQTHMSPSQDVGGTRLGIVSRSDDQ